MCSFQFFIIYKYNDLGHYIQLLTDLNNLLYIRWQTPGRYIDRMRTQSKLKQQKPVQINNQIKLYEPNILTKQVQLSKFIGFKCTHIAFFLCWFGLILAGTTIIGFGANSYNISFDYCAEGQPFCYYDFTLSGTSELFVYIKVFPFYQNNRLYLDAYSLDQLIGQVDTGAQCGSYKTYEKFGIQKSSGGYQVRTDANVHPCGFPMLTLFNDSTHVLYKDGGTPSMNNNITSNYSQLYRFKRLQNYARLQWVDVQQSSFMNWFTISATSTKYMLMGKLTNLTSGDYRLIIKNNYPTKSQITKQIFITEVNNLGVVNHLLGFTIFAYGIGVLLVHVAICCKSKD